MIRRFYLGRRSGNWWGWACGRKVDRGVYVKEFIMV
jgi:hypothetical protein